LSEEPQQSSRLSHSHSVNSGEMQEISLILRHTELDSEDYIAITIKSDAESLDELIQKAKNAFPKKVKNRPKSMDPIN
jgi:hypothetical protein